MLSEEIKNLVKHKLWTALRLGFKFSTISNLKRKKEDGYFIYSIPNNQELICTKMETILLGEACIGNFQADICKILGISINEIKEIEEYIIKIKESL